MLELKQLLLFKTFLNMCRVNPPNRFQVKKKQFFHNFFTIMMFGVIGVFISTFVITCGNDEISVFPCLIVCHSENFSRMIYLLVFVFGSFRQLVDIPQVELAWSDRERLSWWGHWIISILHKYRLCFKWTMYLDISDLDEK